RRCTSASSSWPERPGILTSLTTISTGLRARLARASSALAASHTWNRASSSVVTNASRRSWSSSTIRIWAFAMLCLHLLFNPARQSWQPHYGHCTTLPGRLNRKLTPVSLDHRLHHGQPQTRAMRLGGVERFHNLACLLRVKAGAVVQNTNVQSALRRRHLQPNLFRTRLQAVIHQVGTRTHQGVPIAHKAALLTDRVAQGNSGSRCQLQPLNSRLQSGDQLTGGQLLREPGFAPGKNKHVPNLLFEVSKARHKT